MAAPDPVDPAAAPAGLRFSKMHGAGNDFVVLDLRDGTPPPDPALCRHLADRHLGVGCDQILTISRARSAGAVAGYGIWNADGSPSRQCGNGARCVAAWLVRDGAASGAFVLDSPGASHRVRALGDGRFEVAMGVPAFAPADIPLAGVDAQADAYAFDVGGHAVSLGAVSMGNPHAVIEVDDIDAAPLATLGPALQRHAAFPQQCNVGVAQVLDRRRIRLRVHERGVGETLACGSGACAAVAVLARRGRVDAAAGVEVALPGGTLRIHQTADGVLHMAGPAAFVYEGEFIA
ncbi:diaminopimelate epimerase [Luteimonas sp. MC1895]|uniref:diaminopimelate epimerase n=1 Tax=Luteimonas sp. MC1895 TaxID=2819513 RepID=UPI0018F07126|nr:diaminopimelate epimerase [Luteimonas sp. MC1895]MBJ6978952.1 diaminopimelate epimerase [Luteimonas sp. MC1895]